MSNETIDLLRSSEVEAAKGKPNVEILFDATSLLTWQQRQAMSNFMIGYLSGIVSREQWTKAVEFAFKATKTAYGEKQAWTCLACNEKHNEDVLFQCTTCKEQICPTCNSKHDCRAELDGESDLFLSGDDDGSGLEPHQR
jgi:hypothetical protein